MLKLERITQSGPLRVGMRERSKYFDRALFRALLFSTAFHLVLLSLFRIKSFEFSESLPLRPISVSLESEPTDAPAAFVDISQNRVQPHAFTKALEKSAWLDLCLQSHPLPQSDSSQDVPALTTLESALTDAELSAQIVPLQYSVRLYPLQIKCSTSLKRLMLIDDGSSLFKEQSASNIYPFNTNNYPIEYTVQVDGRTGKIVQRNPNKELVDKELQRVADLLIRRLNFAPAEDRLYSGSIWLHFCCSGEKIGEYLDRP